MFEVPTYCWSERSFVFFSLYTGTPSKALINFILKGNGNATRGPTVVDILPVCLPACLSLCVCLSACLSVTRVADQLWTDFQGILRRMIMGQDGSTLLMSLKTTVPGACLTAVWAEMICLVEGGGPSSTSPSHNPSSDFQTVKQVKLKTHFHAFYLFLMSKTGDKSHQCSSNPNHPLAVNKNPQKVKKTGRSLQFSRWPPEAANYSSCHQSAFRRICPSVHTWCSPSTYPQTTPPPISNLWSFISVMFIFKRKDLTLLVMSVENKKPKGECCRDKIIGYSRLSSPWKRSSSSLTWAGDLTQSSTHRHTQTDSSWSCCCCSCSCHVSVTFWPGPCLLMCVCVVVWVCVRCCWSWCVFVCVWLEQRLSVLPPTGIGGE